MNTRQLYTGIAAIIFLLLLYVTFDTLVTKDSVIPNTSPEQRTLNADQSTTSNQISNQPAITALYGGEYDNGNIRITIVDVQPNVIHVTGVSTFGNNYNQTNKETEAHTGTLDVEIPIENGSAEYRTTNEDGSLCLLEFTFKESSFVLKQKRECDITLASFVSGTGSSESQYIKQ